MLSPSHVADGQSRCGHTVPMRQFALLPPALLSMQLDLRAVGGFCFNAIAAIFLAGHRALLRLVSLYGFCCWLGGPLRSRCVGCSPPKLPLRPLLPPRRVLLGFSCFHVAPENHKIGVQYVGVSCGSSALPSRLEAGPFCAQAVCVVACSNVARYSVCPRSTVSGWNHIDLTCQSHGTARVDDRATEIWCSM